MDWLERLTGIRETTPEEVRAKFELGEGTITSSVNGRTMTFGRLEVVSLAALRTRRQAAPESVQLQHAGGGRPRPNALTGPRVREVVADVGALHREPTNAGATFQVASQFNLLEMVSPSVNPEDGIGRYEGDATQGPTCAIAAGAGTIYRNYFVPIGAGRGQSRHRQIDCLTGLGSALGNFGERLWKMQNGYALPTRTGLDEVCGLLRAMSESKRDTLRGLVQVGIQWNTEVTESDRRHVVTQVYCSALPIAYSGLPSSAWEPFARLILEAAYEATVLVGHENALNTGNRTLFLTLLGGGAFGNPTPWILDALCRALSIANPSLDVVVVSYGQPNADLACILTG